MDFLGDLPTWITALAVLFVFFQYRTDRARRQDKVEIRKREERREREDLTRRLTAWIATNPRDGEAVAKQYFLVISHRSGSMFFDVHITTLVDRDSPTTDRVELNKLPPGQYVVEYERSADGTRKWGWAKSLEELPDTALRPLMQSPNYRVTGMEFTDALGERWQVDDQGVLISAGSPGSAEART